MLFNPLNAELNPICHLLALLGAHHILHISRIRVNKIQCRLNSRASRQKIVADSFQHNNEPACSIQEGEFLVGLKDSYILLKSAQCQIFVHHCVILQKALVQVYINPGHHVAPATKLCVVTPNMCGSSVCNVLHVTFLVPESLKWLQHFWKMCRPCCMTTM